MVLPGGLRGALRLRLSAPCLVAAALAGLTTGARAEAAAETAASAPSPGPAPCAPCPACPAAAALAPAAVPEGAAARALRLAVTDFLVQGSAPAELGRALGDVAAAQAAHAGGWQVVSQGDIVAQLGLEARRQLLGCAGDDACMVEIAGSLDVDRLLAGSVTRLEGTWMLAARLVDVKGTRTLARVSDTLKDATQAELVDAVRRLAHEALTGRRLETAGRLRVEVSEAGARVALDGRELGRSPLEGPRSAIMGVHKLVVQRDGFLPWEGSVNVAAGAETSVRVALVPVEAIEKARRVYAELFAGITLPPAMGATGVADCSGGCVGNLGGIRGGYMVTPRLGVELFLVPYYASFRATERPVTLFLNGIATTADAYRTETSFVGTSGGAALVARFFERFPVTARLWLGAARSNINTHAGGRFYDSPATYQPLQEILGDTREFWTATGGPELRAGVRLSRGILLDVGVGAQFAVLPRIEARDSRSVHDERVVLPPGPGFAGGLAWMFPAMVALHMDFGT